MQKIQLKAKRECLLYRASNNKTECQHAQTLSLTVFPTSSTVLQFNLVCAIALRHTERKSCTATNKQPCSNLEGQSGQSHIFLKFVHTEWDEFQNKCCSSTCTKVSSSSAYPPSRRTTLMIRNKFRQFQLALMSHKSL